MGGDMTPEQEKAYEVACRAWQKKVRNMSRDEWVAFVNANIDKDGFISADKAPESFGRKRGT